MLALFLLSATGSVAPRSAVQPSFMRLRGGDCVETVTNTMSGLQIVSGVFAFMSPVSYVAKEKASLPPLTASPVRIPHPCQAKNIEMYGYEAEATETELAMMRYLAVGQVVLGATSLAGLEGGSKAAQSMALTGGAASLLACAPVFEVSSAPRLKPDANVPMRQKLCLSSYVVVHKRNPRSHWDLA